MSPFLRAGRRLLFRLMTLWLLFLLAVYISAAGHTAPNAATPGWLGGDDNPLREAVCLAAAQGLVCAGWLLRYRRIRRAPAWKIVLGAAVCTVAAWAAARYALCPAVEHLLTRIK